MDELTGLDSTFPPDEQRHTRTATEERAAEICAIAERLLYALGHEWHAYNFEQADTCVIFNVKYPDNGLTWYTGGALVLDSDDEALAERLAAWWDREFRGLNPPMTYTE